MQKMINGDCLKVMKEMQDNSIDFIVCDPPYGINFMNRSFDKFKDQPAFNPLVWKEALRVCKPGSMLAAFGGDRTHHHLMLALEQAGWEIKTCIYWITGQGFPKSHNFGCKGSQHKEQCNRESGAFRKQSSTQERRGKTCETCKGIIGFEGYGTALKPAAEIIVLAMKPLEGTYAKNVMKWGLGGINIDKCRIPSELPEGRKNHGGGTSIFKGLNLEYKHSLPNGRWPANLILDEEAAQLLDQQSGFSKSSSNERKKGKQVNCFGKFKEIKKDYNHLNDSGGASRFFYCAKASAKERNAGMEEKLCGMMEDDNYPIKTGSGNLRETKRQNYHPTVKPLSLMRYIITLLAPPGTPTFLDPFAGSGSTLCAAKQLGINAIGIEIDKDYCEIAEKRIQFYQQPFT